MPGSNQFQTLAEYRAGKNRRCRGAVTGHVGSLARHLFDHLSAHILKFVFELDLLGDRNSILCYGWSTPGFFENDVAPFGTERYGHRVSQ